MIFYVAPIFIGWSHYWAYPKIIFIHNWCFPLPIGTPRIQFRGGPSLDMFLEQAFKK
jgi:hypothetical protein